MKKPHTQNETGSYKQSKNTRTILINRPQITKYPKNIIKTAKYNM